MVLFFSTPLPKGLRRLFYLEVAYMADESNLISWTPANWITVVLMVALAYFILGAVVRMLRERQSKMAAAGA